MKQPLGYVGDLDQPGTDLQIVPKAGLKVDLVPTQLLAYKLSTQRNAERLFTALDGSEVRTSGRRFDLEVYSVTDQQTGRWVQLGLRGLHEHLITLRLPQQSGLQEAAVALSAWLSDPAHVDEILEVA
ncbi:MAG: hypothetical protein ABI051_03610 [Vicinamibacterales bacterium]